MRTFVDWFADRRDEYVASMLELVRIPSTSPDESRAADWVVDYVTARGFEARREDRHPDTLRHPLANPNLFPELPDAERQNLRVDCGGSGGPSDRILFSAHLDVVPATASFIEAFSPRVEGNHLVGRGAADTKGNIVMLAAALDFLDDRKIPRRSVEMDLVIEEEVGGNGALSSCLWGRQAAGAVVLEPTDLTVYTGHRGVVLGTIELRGPSSHVGGSHGLLVDVVGPLIGMLNADQRDLQAIAGAHPSFAGCESPIQVSVSKLAGGHWFGSRPESIRLDVTLGVLPWEMPTAAAERFCGALRARLDAAFPDLDVRLDFSGMRNGGYLGDHREAALAREITPDETDPQAAAVGRTWNVSCDARLYHSLLQIPTVIFGAGSLTEAHGAGEKLNLAQWEQGIIRLVDFLGCSA
ncbi:M20 family metallopeptidase [Streptomyces sp. BE230]|uniref:M20 family metallopeptidase n=1 Tax=Streptomyces sp. BE230 TaxID=3002526 RepID=UPI002ED10A11|nr:M20/M25/M40 family metallo-hydrolase [Streptomyces sp. BE230]